MVAKLRLDFNCGLTIKAINVLVALLISNLSEKYPSFTLCRLLIFSLNKYSVIQLIALFHELFQS